MIDFHRVVIGVALMMSWVAQSSADTTLFINGDVIPFNDSVVYGTVDTFTDSTPAKPQLQFTSLGRVVIQVGDLGGLRIDLSTPDDVGFVPGMYAGAVSGPRHLPQLDVSANGRGCGQEDGWFEILEVALDENGLPTKLALDFLHACEGRPGRLFGALRYNSDIPIDGQGVRAVAGRDRHVSEGSTVTLSSRESLSLAARPLTYRWEQIAGPVASLSDPAAAMPQFVVPNVVPGGEDLTFRLTISDDSGGTDEDSVTIHAHDTADRRTRALIHSPVGELLFRPLRHYYDPNLYGEDTQDLIYEFDEVDWPIRAWVEGDPWLARINWSGAFPLAYDKGAMGTAVSLNSIFDVILAMPFPEPFRTGVFMSVNGNVSGYPGVPSMRLNGAGAGCGQIGAMEILEYEQGELQPDGMSRTITRLAVDFNLRCMISTGVSQPVTGSVRFNSAIPLHDGVQFALPVRPPVSVNVSVSTTTATVGQPVTVTWASQNADYCYGDAFQPFGFLPLSGSKTFTLFTADDQKVPRVFCYRSDSWAEDSKVVAATTSGGGGGGGGSGGGGSGGGGALSWLTLMLLGAGGKREHLLRRSAN